MEKLNVRMCHSCSGSCCVRDSCMKSASPSQKEGDVESRTVEVDKLKKEHLEGEAVLPL